MRGGTEHPQRDGELLAQQYILRCGDGWAGLLAAIFAQAVADLALAARLGLVSRRGAVKPASSRDWIRLRKSRGADSSIERRDVLSACLAVGLVASKWSLELREKLASKIGVSVAAVDAWAARARA